MKKILFSIMRSDLGSNLNNYALLFFRIAVSLELIAAHGFKKLGIGVEKAEVIPNPLGFPEAINHAFATGANIIMPLFIIFGFLTRLATLPILGVTLTGYFILHANDPILVKDVPYIYSVCFLFITITGAGRYSLDNYFSKR